MKAFIVNASLLLAITCQPRPKLALDHGPVECNLLSVDAALVCCWFLTFLSLCIARRTCLTAHNATGQDFNLNTGPCVTPGLNSDEFEVEQRGRVLNYFLNAVEAQGWRNM